MDMVGDYAHLNRSMLTSKTCSFMSEVQINSLVTTIRIVNNCNSLNGLGNIIGLVHIKPLNSASTVTSNKQTKTILYFCLNYLNELKSRCEYVSWTSIFLSN